ncbi:hypothetical protein [Nitratireductor sp. GCM10026969]|uniref:hypothetical protein n=1 Tax=Nitratireductor sp. GCM10026969 TaxID=3252645 RepID=UPI00361FDD31
MFRTIRTAVLSALLGLGTLTAMPAGAQADGFYFSFGQQGPSAGSHHRDRGHMYKPHRGRPRHVSACSPSQALHKAGRMGLRHARVTHASRKIIAVAGHRHRHRARVVFSRAPHCPVIRAM